jgi:DNA-nicking Smr family endonuclease
MSKGGRSGPGGGRTVAPDEAELWSRLAVSVDKVKVKPRVTPQAGSEAPAQVPRRVAADPPGPPPKASATPKAPPAEPPRRPAPLAEFDRRTARQVASGKVTIDARLDLHGVRQREARVELNAFLRTCQAQGCKTVLIITGKGEEASAHRDYMAGALGEPQRGVLRRLVPQWLGDPELRSIVLSFTGAGVRHGGAGALYVQLRRRAR